MGYDHNSCQNITVPVLLPVRYTVHMNILCDSLCSVVRKRCVLVRFVCFLLYGSCYCFYRFYVIDCILTVQTQLSTHFLYYTPLYLHHTHTSLMLLQQGPKQLVETQVLCVDEQGRAGTILVLLYNLAASAANRYARCLMNGWLM